GPSDGDERNQLEGHHRLGIHADVEQATDQIVIRDAGLAESGLRLLAPALRLQGGPLALVLLAEEILLEGFPSIRKQLVLHRASHSCHGRRRRATRSVSPAAPAARAPRARSGRRRTRT